MSFTSTFNAQNELTSDGGADLSFDNNGNTLVDDQGDTLIYNAWNELIAVSNSAGRTIALYSYNGEGQRVTVDDTSGRLRRKKSDPSDRPCMPTTQFSTARVL